MNWIGIVGIGNEPGTNWERWITLRLSAWCCDALMLSYRCWRRIFPTCTMYLWCTLYLLGASRRTFLGSRIQRSRLWDPPYSESPDSEWPEHGVWFNNISWITWCCSLDGNQGACCCLNDWCFLTPAPQFYKGQIDQISGDDWQGDQDDWHGDLDDWHGDQCTVFNIIT